MPQIIDVVLELLDIAFLRVRQEPRGKALAAMIEDVDGVALLMQVLDQLRISGHALGAAVGNHDRADFLGRRLDLEFPVVDVDVAADGA